jgi:hypothetical protein
MNTTFGAASLYVRAKIISPVANKKRTFCARPKKLSTTSQLVVVCPDVLAHTAVIVGRRPRMCVAFTRGKHGLLCIFVTEAQCGLLSRQVLSFVIIVHNPYSRFHGRQ